MGFDQDAAGSATAACTSGLPIFTNQAVTPDCIAAISQALTDRTSSTQDIVEVNTQGKVIDVSAGELRGAVGLSYRKNDFRYLPDATRETNSIIDIPAGAFAQANVFGATNVKEAYTEFLLPIPRNKPFGKTLELELGYRLSDYNTAGNTSKYKGMFSDRRSTLRALPPAATSRVAGNRARNINKLITSARAPIRCLTLWPGSVPFRYA